MFEDAQSLIASYLNLLSDNLWIQIALVLVIAWLVATFTDRLFLKWLRSFIANVDNENPLIKTHHGPLYFSFLLIGFTSVALLLDLPSEIHSTVISILETLAILVWTRFSLRFSRFLLRNTAHNNEKVTALTPKTLPLFENMAVIFISAIATYYIFINWNVDMTAWLASAGIVGIAVGFAAKDTLANLFSGLFIMADTPYKIGDMVVLESGDRGEITKIGIRSTRMLTRDDIEITIPNAIMGNTKIFNESGGRHQKCRIRVRVGVAYGTDIDKVREILTTIGQTNPVICKDPEPRIRFRSFGPSSLDFELCCWIENPIERGRILDSLHCDVYKAFIQHGIEIPYAKHDLYIKQMPERKSYGDVTDGGGGK